MNAYLAEPSGQFGIALLVIYFFPTIVALVRPTRSGAIFWLNILLGWTVFGWIALLYFACTNRRT